MIKLIVFDLDGVLVTTKELHYHSLNKSIESIDSKYIITLNEHHEKYDGLPTSRKLQMLTVEKGLPEKYHNQIYRDKQKYTFDLIREQIKRDDRLISILKQLKDDGYMVYVASNAIRETVKLLLYHSGLMEYVDYFISNEDVKNSKPNSEIYLRCMTHSGVNPDETLIIEDSPRGIEAARNSKAHLLMVKNPNDVSYEKIINSMKIKNKNKFKINNLNILIPMAGLGSRFEEANYTFPKPLIDIYGKPMIQLVIENLGIEANYIYVVRKEHCERFNLKTLLNIMTPDCKIVEVNEVTSGSACTTLMSEKFINNDDMLMIANSDQFIQWDPINFYYKMIETKADGGILTFESIHPKWSYAKLNENGIVECVAEKNPISNHATVGIYWYSRGSDYVKYAKQMIEKNIRVNGEFYVCPIFNEYILDNKKIITYDVDKMMGLGDPESLEFFLKEYKNYEKV